MNDTFDEIYQQLLKLKQDGGEAVLATVIEKEGSTPSIPGMKMLVLADGAKFGNVGGGTLEINAIEDSKKIMLEGKSAIIRYNLSDDGKITDIEETGMICGGKVSIFYEYIHPAKRIYIFGAGHVGSAILHHLRNSDFNINVIDCREEIAKSIEGANHIVIGDYGTVLNDEKIPEGGFFLITTHTHELDYVILKRIYQSNWQPAYIGMLASKRKAESILKKLHEELDKKPDLSFLYTPVGLAIGGNSPDEIAIAIVAQIQAVRYGIEGQKHLRIDY